MITIVAVAVTQIPATTEMEILVIPVIDNNTFSTQPNTSLLLYKKHRADILYQPLFLSNPHTFFIFQ